MKKLVVTDKGIGIAEMPNERDYLIDDDGVERFRAAVKQAIASAPLFEDQERVREILFNELNRLEPLYAEVPHGTYPVPPGFPEYVEVYQQYWLNNWVDCTKKWYEKKNLIAKMRCILRFVDKQEQRNHLVELMKEDEKHGMYEESQEELCQRIVNDLGKLRHIDPDSARVENCFREMEFYSLTIKRK